MAPVILPSEEVAESKEVALPKDNEEDADVVPPVTSNIVEAPKEAAIEVKKEEPMSKEEKVISFLKARNTGGFIPINDLLKSLYGPVIGNGVKPWHDQRTMKLLRVMLDAWVGKRIIIIEGNCHQRLAKHYYPDSTTGVTHYYNLDTLQLRAKLP